MSTYQYSYNNPVLRSDPDGKCPDCPDNDPFLFAKLAATAFYDTKHAIENTALRLVGSDTRVGYKVVDGQQVFETVAYKQAPDNSAGGVVKEAVNATLDVASIAGSGVGGVTGGLLAKTSTTQTTKALKDVAEATTVRKAGGKLTEPTLPDGKIASKGDMSIEHFYKSNDHGPAHAHVIVGGKTTTRVGQNGKPLRGDPELSRQQANLVSENKSKIRQVLKKINQYINFQKAE